MRKKKAVGGKACWDGYRAAGTKKGKNGRTVNNCVPTGKGKSKNDKLKIK